MLTMNMVSNNKAEFVLEPKGINPTHNKDRYFRQQYTGIAAKGDNIDTNVIVRIYETKNRVYACVWVMSPKLEDIVRGSAFAGGYGYHMASKAVGDALGNAGFKLKDSIGGKGDGAIVDAIVAVMECLYSDCETGDKPNLGVLAANA